MNPFNSFGCISLVFDCQFRKTGTVSYGDGLSRVHGMILSVRWRFR